MIYPVFIHVRTRSIDDILSEIKKLEEEDIKRLLKYAKGDRLRELDLLMGYVVIKDMARRL